MRCLPVGQHHILLRSGADAERRSFEVAVKGDQATEMVTVIDAAGNVAHYVFELSKQHDDGPLKDCWMTDGVMRVEPRPGSGQTA